MRKTLHNPVELEAIQQRLLKLTPTTQPLWGKLTAPKLLCHLADALDVSNGTVTPKIKLPAIVTLVFRWMALNMNFPKNGRTAPEMLASVPTAEFERDRQKALDRLAIFVKKPLDAQWHPSAAFGALSGEEWSHITWKHFDHHLRQFGL